MLRLALAALFLASTLTGALGGLRQRSLPECGSIYAPPFADANDAGPRACPAPTARAYTPRHRGIGFEILDLESDACFVPDESYRLLDEIIDDVLAKVGAAKKQPNENPKVGEALSVSKVTGDVLAARGFGLHIPTETLSEALAFRNAPGEKPRHVFDCDTGSMILLTVAQVLSLPASLVEITLPSGSGHNYVRWQVGGKTIIDWDTNGRAQCVTPANVPSFQGKSMSRDEVISYVLGIRAWLWKQQGKIDRAVEDYRSSAKGRPNHPGPLNNFAWLIASTDFPGRSSYVREAMDAASKATSIHRTPNYLDTLACMYALTGDFVQAVNYAKEAIAGSSKPEFAERLQQFQSTPPRDCTGAD